MCVCVCVCVCVCKAWLDHIPSSPADDQAQFLALACAILHDTSSWTGRNMAPLYTSYFTADTDCLLIDAAWGMLLATWDLVLLCVNEHRMCYNHLSQTGACSLQQPVLCTRMHICPAIVSKANDTRETPERGFHELTAVLNFSSLLCKRKSSQAWLPAGALLASSRDCYGMVAACYQKKNLLHTVS